MEEKAYQKFPLMTVILLTVNIAVFVILELLVPQDTSLKVFSDGAMYWPAELEAGQYYRLLTSMFLHFDNVHLVNNMLILFLIGSRLEDLTGRIRFILVYFMSGILAGLTSMVYNILQDRLVIAAGASGAVFGLTGGMLWVVIAGRGRVQGLTGRQMLLFAALSLYGGFVNQQTDNAAHLGGLLAGFLLMMLLYRRRTAGTGMERR